MIIMKIMLIVSIFIHDKKEGIENNEDNKNDDYYSNIRDYDNEYIIAIANDNDNRSIHRKNYYNIKSHISGRMCHTFIQKKIIEEFINCI